jgi:hypothetical protein
MKKAKLQTANMPDAEGGEGCAQDIVKRTRKKNWTDPEIFAAVHSGLGTNEKMSNGRNGPERMNAMQSAFVTRVKYMADKDLWRCVKGNLVTKVTPQESIEMRCVSITSATKDCPIAAQLANMIKIARNQLTALLDKLLNADGTIPSGKQQAEIKEGLRKLYFDSFTATDQEVVSSEDEDSKTERQEAQAHALAQKLDKFHPIELYVYFAYGPAVLGGCGSVYFLKEAKDIQASVAKKTVNSRGKLRDKNAAETDEQAASKKANVVLSATMQDSPTAALGSSFTLKYEEQLKIERERLHEERKRAETDRQRALTDRERFAQEDVLHRIKLAEGLIARAKTAEKRKQYEDELEELMHSALQRPRLHALVADFRSDVSVSSQSLSETGMSQCGMSQTGSSCGDA